MNLFGQSNQKLFPEVEKQSFNVTQEKIEKLKELFPNIVSDGKIDWKTLKLMLGENITEEDERYRFTWSGKNKAIQEVGISTTSTLRPDKDSSKDWNTTENLYIEGDNLEVLKVLQNSYNGKIKMIYIDPPYNTGNDFIYKDDFTLSLEEVEKQEGLKDKKGIIKTVDRLTKNSKDSAKYHTNWLNMMYPRLLIARDLLSKDGAICISIDDNEEENLKKICNEIFDERNMVGAFVVIRSEGGGMAKQVIKGHDYLLVYAKDIDNFRPLGKPKDIRGKIVEKDGEMYWIQEDWLRKEFGKYGNCHYEEILEYKGEEFLKEVNEKLKLGEYTLIPKSNGMNIVGKLRNINQDSSKFYSILKHLSAKGVEELKNIELDKVFDYPKPVSLLKELILGMTIFSKNNEDIILDFFSGSSTTADAVMQLNLEDGGNRKFIMVQVPELSYEGKKDKNGNYIINEKTGLPEIQKDSEARKNGFNYITEIGKTRIRRAGRRIKRNIEKDNFQLKIGEEPKKLPDIGFKTFRIDSSNFNEWDTSYEAMERATKEASEGKFTTYKQDRTDLDLVYEIMLKEGLFLTENIEEIEMNAGTLYKIAEGVMYIFLKKLDKEVVKKIIDLKMEAQELYGLDNPTVILNEAYLDTELKCNAKKNFEVNGIVNIKTL